MRGYTASTYGDFGADVYDAWHRDLDPSDAVTTLAEFGGLGRILELGVGTGRVAIPLAAACSGEVCGVDSSSAMIARLRGKRGGQRVKVVLGDLVNCGEDKSYSLIYAAFNSFFALLSKEEQADCFANARQKLDQDGLFIIEGLILSDELGRGQQCSIVDMDLDRILFEVCVYDKLTQMVEGQTIEISVSGIRMVPIRLRYASIAELDLMGKVAGFRLYERWSGWDRSPFTAHSKTHVSAYIRS